MKKIAVQPETRTDARIRVAIVGPCAAGKSTLAAALNEAGYEARQPAQEHSRVPDMWRRMTNPDFLVYLDVDYAGVCARRPQTSWDSQRLAGQIQQLAHARQQCDLYVDTSGLSVEDVRELVISFLEQQT